APRVAPPADPPRDKPKPDPAPAADEQNAALLSATGALLGAHLYQTYLNIGLLADGVEGEVYTVAEAEQSLDAVTDLMQNVERQLRALAAAGLKEDDQKTLEKNRKLAGLLSDQAKELRAYWKTNDKEKAAKFQKVREEAWAGIKELLNIEE